MTRTVAGDARSVAVLGATGSVGHAACAVLRRHPDLFRVVCLSAHRSADRLQELAEEFEPDFVILTDPEAPLAAARPERTSWRRGPDALAAAAEDPDVDIVVNALVGFAGIEVTLGALRSGKRLALANKESLVAGGDLVLEVLRSGGGQILPVDSEHSAIHQCLAGRPAAEVHRLILTASGGPFRETPADELASRTVADALAHPTWDMGAKITVDSATLANKALEVIEAHLLFGIDLDDIDIVVHPASIVHSIVEFRDGSCVAQMSHPTMETPVRYALSAPDRLAAQFRPLDLVEVGALRFESLRKDDFPLFGLGLEAGRRGGTAPAAYSAANEVAVAAFLEHGLSFGGIADVVAHVLLNWTWGAASDLADLVAADGEARRLAEDRLGRRTATR